VDEHSNLGDAKLRGPRPAGAVCVALHFLSGIDNATRAEVSRDLAAAGVCVGGDGDSRDCFARVVVADSLGDAVLCAVREALGRGASRVMVVTLGRPLDAGRLAWRLLRDGASDIVVWDVEHADMSSAAIAARLCRWQEVDGLANSSDVRGRLVGRSPAWTRVLGELVEAARLADTPVLITGESGTGKELAAGLIHDLDPRPDKRGLVVLDCTTIVPTLSGSEFFGHERGAFTDAVTARDGAFAEADGGTLFLDELAELPLGLQAELLRVIQEGMYKRVGSGLWRRTRFRLVCATNRDLCEEVEKGRFRHDLYHRIAAWTVRLPSLRDRRDDIPLLAEHLLRALRPDLETPQFDPAVLDVLERREYPGNVRELRQLVARIAARHTGPGPITAGDLPADERPQLEAEDPSEDEWRGVDLERSVRRALARNAALHEIGRAAEEIAIRLALEEAGGNLRRASTRLKITDRALQMRRAAARKQNGMGDSG